MIKNAEYIGPVDPTAYHRQPRQDMKRGDKDFVMTRSALMAFWDNPWKWLKGFEAEDSDSTEWGSLMDTLVLDNERFGDRYAVCPNEYQETVMECPACGTRTQSKRCAECKRERAEVKVDKPWNRNAGYCKAWEETQGGRTVLKPHEEESATTALETLTQHADAWELIKCSQKQVLCVAEWRDKSGLVIPLKVLIDLVPDVLHAKHGKRLLDFKTAASADPNRWPFVCQRFSYHVQAAFYLDIYNAATSEDRTDWVHLVQENLPPYVVELIGLDSETIEAGRAAYQMALAEYCQCLTTNRWRSYYVTSDYSTLALDGIPIMKCLPQMQARVISRMAPLTEPKRDVMNPHRDSLDQPSALRVVESEATCGLNYPKPIKWKDQ